MFYTARADDETDVSSCKTEDCHQLVGVNEKDETRLEVKKWLQLTLKLQLKSCLDMNVLSGHIFSFSVDL